MRRKSAFTILEIIVVVVILGLLIGLLLPVYQSSRAQAKVTRSMSNMRQIVIATKLYCEDDLDNIMKVDGPLTLVREGLIPEGMLRTGGGNALVFERSDAYVWLPPHGGESRVIPNYDQRISRWQKHIETTGGNPLILVDTTHDQDPSPSGKPFRAKRMLGAFWDGHVQRKVARGSPSDFALWEK